MHTRCQKKGSEERRKQGRKETGNEGDKKSKDLHSPAPGGKYVTNTDYDGDDDDDDDDDDHDTLTHLNSLSLLMIIDPITSC